MFLIKYYSLVTCYDGQREFTKAEPPKSGNFGRHYPDEYLIANILLKYQHKHFPGTGERKQNLVVLTEPWKGSTCQSSNRDGGQNTDDVNDLIISQINLAQKEQKNTLILVPWLYGYHHPGISIDVKNKLAIYLDPYGSEAHYSEAVALEKKLKNIGFTYQTVTTRQQTDSVNCGPILTGSMIKFTDEFMSSGTISVNGFSAPRPKLATDRLFQMYINNTVKLEEASLLVDEIMLADPSLWKIFLRENGVSETVCQSVMDAVILQRQAIELLPKDWEKHPESQNKVQFISSFQSAITEYVVSNESGLASKIEQLVAHSNQLFDESIESDNELYSIELLGSSYSTSDIISVTNKKPLFVYPESYGQLVADIPGNLAKARRLLEDYTKYNSGIWRFFSGHWDRHHVSQVYALVERIDNEDIITVGELLDELNAIKLVNSKGSLARRIGFITEYCQDFDYEEVEGNSFELF